MTSPIFPCFLRLSWIYWFLYLQELPADFIGSTVSLSLAPEFYGPIPDSRDSLDSLLPLHSAQTTIAFLHFHLWTRCLFEDSTYKFHRHKLEFYRSFANHTLLLEFYVCLQPLCSCCLAALRYFFWFPALVSEIEKGKKHMSPAGAGLGSLWDRNTCLNDSESSESLRCHDHGNKTVVGETG